MSRRKQTKPFKVKDEVKEENETKPKLRKILPKPLAVSLPDVQSTQSDLNSENFVDEVEGDEDLGNTYESVRRSKRHMKCNKCGKILASALSLARHKLTHSQKKPYQCPKCEASFKTSSNMHRHLRIHFRGINGEEIDKVQSPTLPRVPSIRSPRQNIRTPNKFKEFDVHLVGMSLRGSLSSQGTNARSYSKPKESEVASKKMKASRSEKSDNEFETSIADEICNSSKLLSDDESALQNNFKEERNIPEIAKSEDPDLICHICNKSFISKFGLLTHSLSHPDTSTKCNACGLSFTTHKGLVMHNIIVHKIACKNENFESSKTRNRESGFSDLICVDFSANKFPMIAEAACSTVQHMHSKDDKEHIFVCKKCDKAFPLLQSLQLHISKLHKKESIVTEIRRNELDSFMNSINLTTRENSTQILQHDLYKKELKKIHLNNGMDDDAIYTSASVATTNIPDWMMDSPDLNTSQYKNESEIPVKHPRLTLKIVRRKSPSSSSQEEDNLDKSEYDDNYFIDENSSSLLRGVKPQSSSKKVKKVSTNSILPDRSDPMSPYSSERNVFWCRICNYSSHEKSALVRHLLTHSGIRPYFCKLCNYAFTTKANCERHVRKRHNCVERAELNASVRCDWEMLKKAPRDDIYMITGSNSSCPVCSRSFSCNNELKEHLKVHEERQFVCQLCNIRCTTRNNCVRHILHKHPGIPHTEANNIITFAGSSSKKLQMKKLAVAKLVKDDSEIDISRGSLRKRNTPKTISNLMKLKLKRSSFRAMTSSHGNNMKKGTTTQSENQSEASDLNFNNVHEMEIVQENNKTQSPIRPRKIPKLIPLLKIKAYNEAAATSYAKVVSMYQRLNLLKNASLMECTKSSLKDASEDFSPQHEDNLFDVEGSRTTFICQICTEVFETEDELNCHIVSCSGSNKDYLFNGDELDWTLTPTDDMEIDNEGWDEVNSVNISGADNDESLSSMDDLVDLSQSSTITSVKTKVFDDEFQNVEDWVENIVPRSPASNKSSDGQTDLNPNTQFLTDIPRVFAKTTKESSYFEDSLLLSMFNDTKTRQAEEDILKSSVSNESSLQDNILSVSKYSSSLPTMVNMDNLALSNSKYQADESLNSEMNSSSLAKVLVPSKGRFYTARKCPQCAKSFPWASSLRRHIMTHTGLKLYMCRLCKMRFTTRSNLIRHVYRRHGMAKQHPEFASCLAKLHPSDTLLREVEADVRRRVDAQKKRSPQSEVPLEADDLSNPDDDDLTDASHGSGRKKTFGNDFQSMLEEDPETLLVDLDYSPRDDVVLLDRKKQKLKSEVKTPDKKVVSESCSGEEEGQDSLIIEEETASQEEEEEDDQDQPIDMSLNNSVSNETSSKEETSDAVNVEESNAYISGGKNLRLRRTRKVVPDDKPSELNTEKKNRPMTKHNSVYKTVIKPKIRNKQSTQFVCGLCKKIFKTVPDLVEHLDTHDVPHSWHCVICGVPFTNKYNCQRHLTRRHGRSDIEPLYVEDSKHGPRTARGLPRKNPSLPSEDCNARVNSV